MASISSNVSDDVRQARRHLKSKKHHQKIHIQRLNAQEMKEFIYSNDQLKDKASRPSLDHNKLNHIFLDSQKRKSDDLDYPKKII
ncbi:hypothetical protein BpHYR1_028836 [Brachionus plicatilis]|uniref:Uncharacterized protein n=1 Tax=Brachionus plicatilis TaxID=10195 RepID=A0A3M7Q416_BRAPC|nr:hypothetical protein BpHYR1_028836 [Brachionus plicatilis]